MNEGQVGRERVNRVRHCSRELSSANAVGMPMRSRLTSRGSDGLGADSVRSIAGGL